jgi:hypothetical protein
VFKLRNIKISEIFSKIEETDKKIIMLLNAEYTDDEKELVLKYAKAYNKEIRFVTMREFLFNKDDNVLKII